MSKFYLSKERYAELEAEYKNLTTTRRQEVAEKLKRAKEFGDLSENSEYNEAKDEQAQLETRIHEIENILKNSEIIKKNNQSNVVTIGSEVTIEKKGGQGSITYQIVGSQEADPDQGKISNESPVGGSLIGKTTGDEVRVETLNGISFYKIISIN